MNRWMRMGARSAWAALFALQASPASAQPRAAVDFIAAIEGSQTGTDSLSRMTVAELLRTFKVPGLSVAVIRDSRIHWAKGYGTADAETGAPVDTGTLFQAASISKTFNAMAVLKAAQDGLFGLDDDINTILKSWHLNGGDFTRRQPVTPRTLASHVSGLGDAFGYPGYTPGATLPTMVQLLDGTSPSITGPLFMEREPWTAFEYSGGGVTLLQLALIDARKRPYADLLTQTILTPIGLTRSTFEQPLSATNDRNAARAHDRFGKGRGPKWHVYPELAAAGLWTTPSDLARFAIEVERSAKGKSNRVLSPAMAREMLTPVGVGAYAVGFSLSKQGEGWYFSHGGSNWGFQSNLIMHTVKGYGVALMTNGDNGGPLMNEILRRVRRAYAWDSEAAPVPRGYYPAITTPRVTLTSDVLERYAGQYADAALDVTVRLDTGVLQLNAGGGWSPLEPLSETEFVLGGNTRVRFQLTAANGVTGVRVQVSGRDVLLTRKSTRE
ncbi:MAG: serine hydrolase [Gemmatimonadaceae bacterium]|nr:serine hydrolase [Gemmatimonadaceae bacterium]